MSFWSFVKEVLPTVVTAGATIYGANQVMQGNDRAAQQATQASQQATKAEIEALEEAQRNLEINRKAASPGLLRTQEIIARGSRLTPEQKMAVDDSRNQAVNTLQGSSLRGSARATSAIIKDVDTRVRNNFMQQNQDSADSAARGLAGQYFGAGTNLANNQGQQGRALSSGLVNTGSIQASNTLGQTAVKGQAIGDISAVIADQVKDSLGKERDSSYERVQ